MRLVCTVLLIVGLAVPARAQDERGWSFSGSFRGSSNADGVVTRVEPVLGYRFDKRFSAPAEEISRPGRAVSGLKERVKTGAFATISPLL